MMGSLEGNVEALMLDTNTQNDLTWPCFCVLDMTMERCFRRILCLFEGLCLPRSLLLLLIGPLL